MGTALVALLALALLSFVSAHLALVVGLALRAPRWHAAVALLVAPLAPFWGLRAGMRRLALAWLVSLGLYALGVALAAARTS